MAQKKTKNIACLSPGALSINGSNSRKSEIILLKIPFEVLNI